MDIHDDAKENYKISLGMLQHERCATATDMYYIYSYTSYGERTMRVKLSVNVYLSGF